MQTLTHDEVVSVLCETVWKTEPEIKEDLRHLKRFWANRFFRDRLRDLPFYLEDLITEGLVSRKERWYHAEQPKDCEVRPVFEYKLTENQSRPNLVRGPEPTQVFLFFFENADFFFLLS